MYTTNPIPQDARRINELSDLISAFTFAVNAHFQATGQSGKLNKNMTAQDRKDLRRYTGELKQAFGTNSIIRNQADAAFYNLKTKEIFARAALRAGNTEMLAHFMPRHKLEQSDVVLFKRYEMNSLATIIQAALK